MTPTTAISKSSVNVPVKTLPATNDEMGNKVDFVVRQVLNDLTDQAVRAAAASFTGDPTALIAKLRLTE